MILVRINCAPSTVLKVAEELVNRSDVQFVTIATGGFDIIAELIVHGGASRYPGVLQQLQPIDGVERWRSDLIMHVYKWAGEWGPLCGHVPSDLSRIRLADVAVRSRLKGDWRL